MASKHRSLLIESRTKGTAFKNGDSIITSHKSPQDLPRRDHNLGDPFRHRDVGDRGG